RTELERQRGRLGLEKLDVLGRPLAAFVEQLGHEVDTDHLADERRQRDRQCPGTGADVERPLLPGQRQQGAQPLARLRGAPVLGLRDERGRLGEALACGIRHTSSIRGATGADYRGAAMSEYVYSMYRADKFFGPDRQVLANISLSFLLGAKIGVL